MIVKNEDKNLDICLRSVRDYFDEIVIVDTGSSDKTKEIALKYTDKIYDFTWCDDFSKARNYSVSKSKYDWVLILDADEVVTGVDCELLPRFVNEKKDYVGRIRRISAFQDSSGVKRYFERVNRLFNKKNYEYSGRIHEQVVPKNRKEYFSENIDVFVDHIGYTNDIVEATNKIQRNVSMLLTEIKQNSGDPYLYYQLGKSYFFERDYERASESFEAALSLKPAYKYEYVEDLVETYGYSLINSNRFQDALKLAEYEKYYKNSPDFNFLWATICRDNGMLENSIERFLSCIGPREGKIEGINSYLSLYNIGVIFECLGMYEEALGAYGNCDNYDNAKMRIEYINNKKLGS